MVMQLSLTIDGLRHDVTALTELGDESIARAGERIAAALAVKMPALSPQAAK